MPSRSARNLLPTSNRASRLRSPAFSQTSRCNLAAHSLGMRLPERSLVTRKPTACSAARIALRGFIPKRARCDLMLMKWWHSLQKTRGPVPEAPKTLAGGGARNERNHRNPKRGSTRPEGGAAYGALASSPAHWDDASRAGMPAGTPVLRPPAPTSGRVRVMDAIRWFRSFLAPSPTAFRSAAVAFSDDNRAACPPDFSVPPRPMRSSHDAGAADWNP